MENKEYQWRNECRKRRNIDGVMNVLINLMISLEIGNSYNNTIIEQAK